jgi:hypothetical protein
MQDNQDIQSFPLTLEDLTSIPRLKQNSRLPAREEASTIYRSYPFQYSSQSRLYRPTNTNGFSRPEFLVMALSTRISSRQAGSEREMLFSKSNIRINLDRVRLDEVDHKGTWADTHWKGRMILIPY